MQEIFLLLSIELLRELNLFLLVFLTYIDLNQNPPIIDNELSFLESTLKVSPAFRIMLI